MFKFLKKRNLEGGLDSEDSDNVGYIPVYGQTADELLHDAAGSKSFEENFEELSIGQDESERGKNNAPNLTKDMEDESSSPVDLSSRIETQPKATIFYYNERGHKMLFTIEAARTTIGRRATNDIPFPTKNKISKEHAVIERVEDSNGLYSYYLRDMKSANGVSLNGTKIDSTVLLQNGDHFELGTEVRLNFVLEEDYYEESSAFSNKESSIRGAPSTKQTAANDHENYSQGSFRSNSGARNSLNRPLSSSSRRWSHRSSGSMRKPLEDYAISKPSRLSMFRKSRVEKSLKDMVIVLPSRTDDEEKVQIHAEMKSLESSGAEDFQDAANIKDIEVLREDYEKLRLAYQLSKYSISEDLDSLLQKLLDLVFSVLPSIDRGIVLLVDKEKSSLVVNSLKIREGLSSTYEKIIVSMTILNWVIHRKTCLITSDALQDPSLNAAKSIAGAKIRSVISVPLISHNNILGILHLDSCNRIDAFKEKDLSLIRTIAHQAAIFIENTTLLQEMETELRIVDQLGRFLPPQVVERVVQRDELISQEGREIVGTVLFADIRGFTNMSESTSPQELVNLLNDYFERLVEVVFKWDGVLDKYIGDALMAVFGTIDDEVDPVYKSVGAALGIREAIREMNDERKALGKAPIGVGVGLNTGTLVAGFIGCNQRLEYTCIGDTVNTSSRICGVAQHDQVLIAQSTLEAVNSRVSAKYVDRFMFKGKQQEVAVYEALELL